MSAPGRPPWRSFTTTMTAEERAVRIAAFQGLLRGAAVDRAVLVRSTGLDPQRVFAVVDDLVRRGSVVVEPGTSRVVGAGGLSLVPTDHRLYMRGRELFTWCAWDAVGIPAALSEDATVSSSCGQCGGPVRVELQAGRVVRADPPTTLLWLRPNEPGRSVVGFT